VEVQVRASDTLLNSLTMKDSLCEADILG